MSKAFVMIPLLAAAAFSGATVHAQTRAGDLRIPATGFGTVVAVQGDEIYVGQPDQAVMLPMPPTAGGTVLMFRADEGGMWQDAGAVNGGGVEVGDGFGAALAVDGNVLVVGAPHQDGAKGAVYVFEREGPDGAWTEAAHLTGDAAAGDSLGFAVALHRDLALVGAPGRGEWGAVYVFHREDGAWEHHHTLEPAQGEAGMRFGAALAMHGPRALIGAPGTHPALPVAGPPPPFQTGAAYVFRHEPGGRGWLEEAVLSPSDARTVRAFGTAVHFDDDGAFVSAPVTGGFGGAVLLFGQEGETWTEQALLNAGQPQGPALLGMGLARAGDDLLVGAPAAGNLHGTVSVYRRDDDGAWAMVQSLEAEVAGLAPFLGMSIAATDDLVVLGAPGADFFEGSGIIFARDASGSWSSQSTIAPVLGGMARVVGEQVDCTDGTAAMFGCSQVDLVAFLPNADLGAKRGIMVNDLWGWTDPETKREYAIVGRFDATAFVDISDPANPVYLGELPKTEGSVGNLWRDIKVYRNHAFIVADNAGAHGVQIFDLTQLRDVLHPPVVFEETAHYDGIHSAHNIVINEATGFAYTVGNSGGGETCGGALHMINIQEPTNPTFAGCYADPQTGNASTGYTHDAQCVVYHGPDPDHQGREICFNASENAIGIGDVTDKANPAPVSRAPYPSVGYAHQGWLSDDHRHFFLNDELDELAGSTPKTRTLVWDVEDLDDPVLLTEFMGTTEASDHNLYVKGRYMYQSNYVSGLRIIDINDPANPIEVGYFDTVPAGGDSPGFAGSWSNFPFFESGVIAVTSMREGLFLLRHRVTPVIP